MHILHFPRVNTEKMELFILAFETNCGKSYLLIIFDYQVISNLLLEILFYWFLSFPEYAKMKDCRSNRLENLGPSTNH